MPKEGPDQPLWDRITLIEGIVSLSLKCSLIIPLAFSET
jgi:hypothetical protein